MQAKAVIAPKVINFQQINTQHDKQEDYIGYLCLHIKLQTSQECCNQTKKSLLINLVKNKLYKITTL